MHYIEEDDSIIGGDVLVSLAYFFCAACFVAPPQEFVAAGVTIQNLFDRWLGSEMLNFIHYHVKRSSMTLFTHSLIPIGHVFTLLFCNYHRWGLFSSLSTPLRLYQCSCVLIPICVFLLIIYWRIDGWSNHPISRRLSTFAPTRSSWRASASSLNVEFRRADKFSSGLYSRRLYVTDTWIAQVHTYGVNITLQSDAILSLDAARDLNLTYRSEGGEESGTGGQEGPTPTAQYLSVRVVSVSKRWKPFYIRLNAGDLDDLKLKLQAPFLNARQIMIRQTQADGFLQSFAEVVTTNQRYSLPQDEGPVETCIGCLQQPAGVKLVRLCVEDENDGNRAATSPTPGPCGDCFCRPLWCLSCLGKWFSSRQDQGQSHRWMSGRAPCPMCRATFCVADVCLIE